MMVENMLVYTVRSNNCMCPKIILKEKKNAVLLFIFDDVLTEVEVVKK